MDITCYLPDDLGEQAKKAGLPLSRLLRDAVAAQLSPQAEMVVEAVPVIYYRPKVTLPDGSVIFCGHKYLHETPEAAQPCGLQMAALGEFRPTARQVVPRPLDSRLSGIACPYCKTPGDENCVSTETGRPLTYEHLGRWKAAGFGKAEQAAASHRGG
jgi:hypothetical protein